jgi:glycosyltransferase involved in cell wall biosynthesis
VSGFSIVVPTYQRPTQLALCLEGLCRLNYPPNRFEVIVVDDGGSQRLDTFIGPWRDRLQVKLIAQPNAGPAAARNCGAKHASLPYLAFIDDDCVPHPEWLGALAGGFESAPHDLIGGQTINALPENPFSSASQQLVTYLCGYFNGRNGRSRLFTSNNMAVMTDDFHAAGGFDARFPRAAGEDREFCHRWVTQGRATTHVPEARVLHAHAMTLLTFWRQHFEYGRAAARFRRGSLGAHAGAVRLEPLSFYTELLWFPFTEGMTHEAFRSSTLLALSQVANASGFLWSKTTGS